jgi:hypothetical protein
MKTAPAEGPLFDKTVPVQWFVAGWGTWIRTKTNRVRVCCATVTPFPNEALDLSALSLEVLQYPSGVSQIQSSAAARIAVSAFMV